MVIFTKSYLSGLNRDQTNTWDNIVLKFIEDNWTLPDPPKYHPVTAKHGVLFGTDYFGQWDYVASAEIKSGKGVRSNTMSIGGRHQKNEVDVDFTFSVRKYNVQSDELPEQVTLVADFIYDLIDRNPRGLINEGVRYMRITNQTDGELEMFGQQVYQMDFSIKLLISKINLE